MKWTFVIGTYVRWNRMQRQIQGLVHYSAGNTNDDRYFAYDASQEKEKELKKKITGTITRMKKTEK